MHSNSSEQSVIGALLIKPDCFDEIDLVADDFLVESHKLAFKVISRMCNAGKAVDVITIAEALESSGELDRVGGLKYLGSLAQTVPSAANIKHYATTVRNHALLRELNEISHEITAQTEKKSDAVEIAEMAESRIFSVMEKRGGKEPVMLSDALEEALIHVEERYSGASIAMPTGLTELDELLGGGFHRGSLNILAARPKMGKELTNNSKVLLSNGEFKRMGDMQMNDSVASVDGGISKVTGVFPQGIKPVYKITFADGRSVDAGLDHQWEVMYRDWDSARVLTTSELIQKIECQRYKNRLYIPYPSGDFGCDIGLSVNPYLLGVLLGDGNFTHSSIRISTSYEYLKNKIEPHLMGAKFSSSGGIDYRLTTARGLGNNLLDSIKSLGLMGKYSHEKFIPEQYLSASKNSRLELMRGLIDTDGTVEKSGSMTYTTTSEIMAKQFQSLARSLGAYASMSSRITKYPYKGELKEGKRSYRICVSCNDYSEFVTIPHKLERVKEKVREKNLNIISIEYIGEFDCQCISVSHKRELYIANEYTVTHNTALACTMAVTAARKGGVIYFASLEMPRREIANRMIAITSGYPTDAIMHDHNATDAVTAAIGTLKELKIIIDDECALTIGKLRSRVRKTQRKHGLQMVVVDYLQLMRGEGSNREQEIAAISRGLKGLSKELDCPVLCLAQVNRECESRTDKRPHMSDLRESGAIEQDADLVMMIYRDEVYNKESDMKGVAEVLIRANRHGANGEVFCQFDGHLTRFQNLDRCWTKPEQQKRGRGL